MKELKYEVRHGNARETHKPRACVCGGLDGHYDTIEEATDALERVAERYVSGWVAVFRTGDWYPAGDGTEGAVLVKRLPVATA